LPELQDRDSFGPVMSISTTLLRAACRAPAGRPGSASVDKITAQPFSVMLNVFKYLREGLSRSSQSLEISVAAAMTW
jgi:hypothetical protein